MVASQLFQGEVQFADANGAPYAGGSVYFYVPGTSTPSATWQDINQSAPNTNPIILDSAGRCRIWGVGEYRQVLYDQNGVLIWDQIVASEVGVQSPGSSVDGDLVIWKGTSGELLADSGVTLAALAFLASTVGVINFEVFVASGTYTPTAGMLFALVIATGAGGGGAGTPAAGNGAGASGGGGGGGGTSISLVSAAQVGVNKTVTIGSGGTGGADGDHGGFDGTQTAFGGLVVGLGGIGAPGAGGTGVPGAGAAIGTGLVAVVGGGGSPGLFSSISTLNTISGAGGGSFWGDGGAASMASSENVNGINAMVPGRGRGGGASNNSSSSANGGNGANGYVVILEFCSSPAP